MSDAFVWPRWVSHTAQFRWFHFQYPPSWSVVEKGETVVVRSPDGQTSVSLQVIRRQPSRAAGPLVRQVIADRFPVRRRLRTWRFSQESSSGQVWSGEAARRPAHKSWWNLLSRRRWFRWKLWSLESEQLIVVVTLAHEEDFDPEMETMTGAIVRTVQINAHPCDRPDVFLTRTIEFVRREHPHLPCRAAGELKLQLGTQVISLQNVYREYLRDADQFEMLVGTAVDAFIRLREWAEHHPAPALEDVRDRILPMLVPDKALGDDAQFLSRSDAFDDGDNPVGLKTPAVGAARRFVAEPWVANLVVSYVVDEENSYWFIPPHLLDKWELSLEDLAAIAMENLDRYFEDAPMELTVMDGAPQFTMAMPVRADVYNTTRLLSPTFQRKMRELLGGPFAVGLPNRDFFVAMSLGLDETLEQIQSRVRNDFRQMSHPLTERLLLVTPDGVSEYV